MLFYVLLIAPVMEYVKARDEGEHQGFSRLRTGRALGSRARPDLVPRGAAGLLPRLRTDAALRPPRAAVSREPLRARQVAAVGVAIALLSFVTHLVFSIGEEHFHIQFALFPQYAILFGLGCAAGRRGWLETLTPQLRRQCGIVGLVAILALPVLLLGRRLHRERCQQDLYAGGWHWQAAGTSLVEASPRGHAAALPYRLVSSSTGPARGRCCEGCPNAAYGAFIIHPPVIVGLALALHRLQSQRSSKFILVLIGGVIGSFGNTALLLRIAASAGSWARGRDHDASAPGRRGLAGGV